MTAYDDDQNGVEDATPSQHTSGHPGGGVFLHGTTLFVSETSSHRVVVFEGTSPKPLSAGGR